MTDRIRQQQLTILTISSTSNQQGTATICVVFIIFITCLSCFTGFTGITCITCITGIDCIDWPTDAARPPAETSVHMLVEWPKRTVATGGRRRRLRRR